MRSSISILFNIYALFYFTLWSEFIIYLFREWSKLNAENDRSTRDHPGIVLFKNQILVVGGSNENRELLKYIESYDFDTNQWSVWSSELNIAREGPGVIQIDESVYGMDHL